MVFCILCLQKKPKRDFIELSKPESLHIGRTIEQHLWQLDGLMDGCVCFHCWDSVSTFHAFYMKVKNSSKECANIEGVKKKEEVEESLKTTLRRSQRAVHKASQGRPRKKRASVEYFDITSNERVAIENLQPQMDAAEEQNPLEVQEKCKLDMEPIDATIDKQDDLGTSGNLKEQEMTITKKNRVYSQKTITSRNYDKFIAENYNITCCLCQKPLSNFAELKAHFQQQHNTRGYVQCCGKKLLGRGVLVDHIHFHQDPQYFQCTRCQKAMSDRRTLELHMKNHEDNHDRIHHCNICSKSFYRRVIFLRHMLLHVPDEEKLIACPQCDKRFTTKYFMNQHLKLVHLNMYSKICDICGKSFRGLEAFKLHQEKHSGLTRPPIQCEHCGVTLTSKYGLSRHIKVMHSEENLQPQTCAICSKVSPTMTAHKRHMQYMHKMERKHRCPLCEKAFKRATDLKEHMTTHTGDVLYTCPHCPKTFNSNANMHSHRKKVHREEWEEKRRQRFQTNLPKEMEKTQMTKNQFK